MSEQFLLEGRTGTKPDTTGCAPHSQINQHGPDAIVDRLIEWSFSLPGIEEQHSRISVPGARALVLKNEVQGNPLAFMVGREFAHIHPRPDYGSLHLKLAPRDATEVAEKGWGEHHPLVRDGIQPPGLVMVYSPRDEAELEVVKTIISHSHGYACGTDRQRA